MKATHLEQIAHDYERAEENQKLMKEGITRQESVRTINTFCIAYNNGTEHKQYGVC